MKSDIEEKMMSNKTHLEKALKDLNDRIQNCDEKISNRMLFEKLGFDITVPFPDFEWDCFGYDKNGYHQLYEIGLVPIES